jgi:uncharacterized protein YkwD
MSRACAWALHLAQVGALSHNAPGCNGGQVVGYTWHSAPGGQSNGPAEVINGWFNSPPHHANLIMPIYSTIGLAFVMRTSADGAWAVYGVGNLCP